VTRDLISESYRALRHDGRRTTLTMLGMAWGIATVVLLLAYGAGFERAIENIFANFGTRVLRVYPGRTALQSGGETAGRAIRLTIEDVDRIANGVPAVRNITPRTNKQSVLQQDTRRDRLEVIGCYPAMQNIWDLRVAEGRFFNEADRYSRARVVVISSDTKPKFFGQQPAVGETLRIDGITFQVIGVLQAKMQENDDDINMQVYIPHTTMGDLRDVRYPGSIWMNYEGNDFERVEEQVRGVLALHHRFDPRDKRAVFVGNSMRELSQFRIISAGIKILLAFIGTLTLGIGGVGLMNIMLVAVNQRTREIGLLKAVGARRRDILLQFLSEALVITLVGGILGVALSLAVSYGVGSLTLYSAFASNAEAGDIQLFIDPRNLLIATVILALVGLISGMLPAVRAANLDPVEALRHE
jgi:putative ABC transport system permease protein